MIRIDPGSDEVVARIRLDNPTWTAAGAGSVWVVTPGGLSRIDPATNAVGEAIPIPGPLGDPSLVKGNVWVPRVRANRIAIVDPESNAVVRTVGAGNGPFVVTEIRGEAWVPSWQGNDVRRYRP